MEQLINLIYSVDDYSVYLNEIVELIEVIRNSHDVKYECINDGDIRFYTLIASDFRLNLKNGMCGMLLQLCKDNILVDYYSNKPLFMSSSEFYKLTDEQMSYLLNAEGFYTYIDHNIYKEIPKPERCIKVKSAIF